MTYKTLLAATETAHQPSSRAMTESSALHYYAEDYSDHVGPSRPRSSAGRLALKSLRVPWTVEHPISSCVVDTASVCYPLSHPCVFCVGLAEARVEFARMVGQFGDLPSDHLAPFL